MLIKKAEPKIMKGREKESFFWVDDALGSITSKKFNCQG